MFGGYGELNQKNRLKENIEYKSIFLKYFFAIKLILISFGQIDATSQRLKFLDTLLLTINYESCL